MNRAPAWRPPASAVARALTGTVAQGRAAPGAPPGGAVRLRVPVAWLIIDAAGAWLTVGRHPPNLPG